MVPIYGAAFAVMTSESSSVASFKNKPASLSNSPPLRKLSLKKWHEHGCAARHAPMHPSKITFALFALHGRGRVLTDESALTLGKTATARFGND
jgi:hypothetical protein